MEFEMNFIGDYNDFLKYAIEEDNISGSLFIDRRKLFGNGVIPSKISIVIPTPTVNGTSNTGVGNPE